MKEDIQKIMNHRFDDEREIMNFEIVVHELIHEGIFHDSSMAHSECCAEHEHDSDSLVKNASTRRALTRSHPPSRP